MKYKDRAEILAQLSEEFVPEKDQSLDRLKTEVVRIDGHNVARVTEIKDVVTEQGMFDAYPASYCIKDILVKLNSMKSMDARDAYYRLKTLYINAYREQDFGSIESLIKKCKDFSQRLHATGGSSVKEGLVCTYIVSEISKL